MIKLKTRLLPESNKERDNRKSIRGYMSKFEDNGGYYIDGVPYMDCKYTGTPVRNVSEDVTYVISDKALMSKMYKLFPEDMEKN